MKHQVHKDRRPGLYFWRDSQGHEIDAVIEQGQQLTAVEIKAGKTINTSFIDGLAYWNSLSGNDSERSFLVYGGAEKQKRKGVAVLGWQDVQNVFEET